MRIVSLLVIASSAAAPLAAQSGTRDAPQDTRAFRVPQKLGPFTLSRRQQYDDPAAGTLFRYSTPDRLLIDVFVYPGPDLAERCNEGCAAGVMDREFEQFRDGFPDMRSRGYVDSIDVVAETDLEPREADAWRLGRAMTMRVVRKGEVLRSDFVVWYLPHHRVKLRSSYPDREPMRAYVRHFTDSLVAGIVQATAEPPRVVSRSVTIPGTTHARQSTATTALRELGYVVQDSTSRGAVVMVRAAARSDWQGRPWMRESDSLAQPAFRMVVVLQPRGDSTTVIVAAEPLGEAPLDSAARERALDAVQELIARIGEIEEPAADPAPPDGASGVHATSRHFPGASTRLACTACRIPRVSRGRHGSAPRTS